jgi:membrane-bound lytic murein transglycosylase D
VHAKFLSLAAIVTLIAGCSHPSRPAAPPVPEPLPAVAPVVSVPQAEVGRVAERVFLDSVVLRDDGQGAEDGRPTYDIDVRSYETHARVEHYVSMFTRNGAREEFTSWLERGTRYDAMIRAKLRAGGIPEDMTYLALVESGYDPNAYSRSAAVGMWQFMTSTARELGLRVDWWVDERRDPVRATDAAIRHIRWLQKQFGSLYLAAAAYNGGEGRVSRGLTQFASEMEGTEGDDRFFALAEKDYLYAETKNYVPQIIAAAIIAKEPAKYGIVVRARAPLAVDTVLVPAATPLSAIATAAGISLAEIVELNPQLLRGMTPPTSAYTVSVPAGRGDGFSAALDALPAADREAFRRTESKAGETLRMVAERMDASVASIALFNADLATVAKGKQKGRLRAGQSIRVPTPALLAAVRDVPDPSIERRSSTPRVAPPTTVRHVVKRGESLGGIARKYDTSVGTLRSLNGLKTSVIPVGRSLIVRRTAGAGAENAGPRARGATKASASKSSARSKAGVATRARSKPGATRSASAASKAKSGAKTASRKSTSASSKSAAKSKSKIAGATASGSGASVRAKRAGTSASTKAASSKPAAKKPAAKKPAAKRAKSKAAAAR